jgi:hypothetical protein
VIDSKAGVAAGRYRFTPLAAINEQSDEIAVAGEALVYVGGHAVTIRNSRRLDWTVDATTGTLFSLILGWLVLFAVRSARRHERDSD